MIYFDKYYINKTEKINNSQPTHTASCYFFWQNKINQAGTPFFGAQ